MYYDNDADLGLIKGKTVAVIGFGSQGHAHAQNLRDSGVEVVVSDLPGTPNAERAQKAGFEVLTRRPGGQARRPDHHARARRVRRRASTEATWPPSSSAGKVLMFAHGFNIHFNQIVPPKDVDVIMVAPKGPGHLVRRQYEEGKGVPSLIAVYQDASGKAKDLALAYAKGIGATRAGVIETSFAEETETDLFGEQAVLCGGVTELIMAGFDTLRRGGLPARDRLLRVPPRAQADRRPHLGAGHQRHALLDQRHRRVRRPHARPRGDRRGHPRPSAPHAGRHSQRRLRARVDPRKPGRPARLQRAAAPAARSTRSRSSASSCAA